VYLYCLQLIEYLHKEGMSAANAAMIGEANGQASARTPEAAASATPRKAPDRPASTGRYAGDEGEA
jgi:hypothetical protein